MAETEDTLLYDVRVTKYHLRRGKLTSEQLAAHLASLPDDAEHGEPTVTRFASNSEGRERRER